ncbi:MAG: phosphoribosylglycinamide formyltransferase [Sedimenticola sp.]|nr:phosphoribosylglycinamide formyltransferase [Sedimenticola sp.]
MSETVKLPIVVLVSGSGSNLQAIIDAADSGLPVEIRAVISNRAEAFGLTRAERAGIATAVLDHQAFQTREAYDRELVRLIDSYQPGLVVLAGFMRILTPQFVNHYRDRLLNIHPSLLPNYRGLHTHRRVLEAGDREHGASVHLVTEELDGGPLLLQVRVPVEADDDEETLAARVLSQEHIIYPTVIGWFAEGRIKVRNGTIQFDGKPLEGALTMPFNGFRDAG